MYNKKKLTSSLIAILLAGVVAFYACNKDDLKPVDDGKNLAKELCDCFTKAGNNDAQKLVCLEEFENKANKWKGEDKKAFDAAFDQAVCTPTPYQWKSAFLGKKAAQEMCACFSAADGGMMCMMGLMTNYDGYFRDEENDFLGDPDFENAFDAEFYNCANVPDWFICMFDPQNCPEVEKTDEELAVMGQEVAEGLCDCLAGASSQDAMMLCAYGLAEYFHLLEKPAFYAAFFGKLGSSCPDAISLIEGFLQTGSQ